ncbi:MAG: phosphoglucosamine mutase [Acidobacteria bacterium]|nr:phosphoglucosamine mutase [Acidobacteriota bacterium]
MTPRLFGTDGVRGVAGRWPLDPPTLARLGAALVRALPKGRPRHLVVGRDTRESGEWIERELARGAAAEGAIVSTAGVVPTPAVAYVAGAFDFDLGLVISASHNPHPDNGVKVFSGRGEKFDEAEERAVEEVMADESWGVPGRDGSPQPRPDLVDAYLQHVARLLPDAGSLAGSRIAIDMANGATTRTAARLLEAMGFEVVALGDQPDGRNINLDCGSTHPQRIADTVVRERCRLGVAFDGDGDRAIFVDAHGRTVDGDAVLLMLALDYQRDGRLTGDTVVATVMSNAGLELALRQRGIRMLRTPVGDKHVMDEMRRGGFALGGEQSGHIVLAEHLPTGDGLATTLAVLRVMARTGRELTELAGELVVLPQTLKNVRVSTRTPIDDLPLVQAEIERVTAAIAGRGRVLVRYSGTEPLLRVMIEGEDQARVERWADDIVDAVRKALG